MLRSVVVFLLLLSGRAGFAQYDLGIGVGGSHSTLNYNIEKLDIQRIRIESYELRPANNATYGFFYREAPDSGVRICIELQWSKLSYYLDHSELSRTTFSRRYRFDVSTHWFHVAMIPEFRLVQSGKFKLRLGPHFGILTATHMVGSKETQEIGMYSSFSNDYWVKRWSLSELRMFVGLGTRLPIGERFALYVDPYIAIPIGKARISESANCKFFEYGIKVSVALNVNRRAGFPLFWKNLRAGATRSSS